VPMYSGVAASGTAQGAQPGAANPAGTPDLTGSYLGYQGGGPAQRVPHVVPNPFDNTLLVQGTPQEWEQIAHLLEQLDVPPRQVLIDAKIYEVDLTGALSAGVTAFLQKRASDSSSSNLSSATPSPSRVLGAVSSAGGLTLTAGALVLRSHELLGLLTATDTAT